MFSSLATETEAQGGDPVCWCLIQKWGGVEMKMKSYQLRAYSQGADEPYLLWILILPLPAHGI